MNLKQIREEYGIKRIDFNNVKPVNLDNQQGLDNLICPYCRSAFPFDDKKEFEIIEGTPYQCPDCSKYFYVTGHSILETTCTPIENRVLNPFIRHDIEDTYKRMDECKSVGIEYMTIEWKYYKKYAEPLFKNMEMGNYE